MVTDAAEHGWLCGPLIRGRSPVRLRVLRLRAGKCPAGAHNPSRPGAVPGPATIVRTVAPPRRRAARSGSGALAHQEEHLTCNEEAVGSSPTSSTIQPRWWNGQHASLSRRRSPVRTRYGVRAPLAGTTRPRPAARWPTWWNADTPDPKPGAARRGGASPPVGTTPPAPAGPRPLYRRVRGSAPRGGSGLHRRPATHAEVVECRHASPRSWCPPGRASATLAFRTRSTTRCPSTVSRLLRRRVPAVRTGGGGGRHPEEALVGPADRQRGSGGTVDTPGREPGAHKGCAGPSPAFRTQQRSNWL